MSVLPDHMRGKRRREGEVHEESAHEPVSPGHSGALALLAHHEHMHKAHAHSVDESGGDMTRPRADINLLRPSALCISERQLHQTDFHNRHAADFLSFWSQRALEAVKMPEDRVKALELRTRTVKRIMRVAMLETLNESKSKDKVRGRAAVAGSAHPLSSSRKSGGEGGVGSDMQAGTNATRTGSQEGVHKDRGGDEDDNRETFAIRDDACYVMARACEMFAMDLTKRSELVMEDQKRARFSLQKGERAGHTRAQLKKEEVLAAIDSTDYCDFLVDLVQAEL